MLKKMIKRKSLSQIPKLILLQKYIKIQISKKASLKNNTDSMLGQTKASGNIIILGIFCRYKKS